MQKFYFFLTLLSISATLIYGQNLSNVICDKGIFPEPDGSPTEAVIPSLTEEDATPSPSEPTQPDGSITKPAPTTKND